MATAREILLSEDTEAQAQLLLSLLTDAANGRDLFGVATDVIQVFVASGAGTLYTKKLAYDLCKLVSLSESDCDLLFIGIKNDLASPFPDAQVTALQFLPHLPGQQLCGFLDRGDVRLQVEPSLRSGSAEVRAAGAVCLARILLNQDILTTAAASQGIASTFQDWWDLLADGLVDPSSTAVTGAVAAVNMLLSAAEQVRRAGGQEPQQVLVKKLAGRVAGNVAAGLGPVLQQCKDLAPGMQADLAALLVHLARHTIHAPGTGAEVTLSTIGQQLVAFCSSINPAVRMEAAKGLLGMARSMRQRPPLSDSLLAPPPVWSTTAMTALLGLRDRQYVEAALNDIIVTVAGHLDELQVGQRMGVVRKLLPLVGGLPEQQARVKALALLWEALLQLHLSAAEARARGDAGAGATTLHSFLSDPLVKDLLAGVQGPAGLTPPATPDSSAPSDLPSPSRPELKRALSLDMFKMQGASTPSSLPSPTTPMQETKPQLPVTFHQEVTTSLLCVLTHHPAVLGVADLQPLDADASAAAAIQEISWRERQASAVQWLSAATAALAASSACLLWEPYVQPASSEQLAQASASSTSPPAWLLVNYTSVPPDAWLRLQAAATHVLRCVLRSLGHPTMGALLRHNNNRTLERLHPGDNGTLARAFALAASSLQVNMKKVLSQWEELALTVRPRVLWVAAYSLELPPFMDDTWIKLLACLESLLLVGPLALPETHLRDMAVATMAGCLYPSTGLRDGHNVSNSVGGLAGALAKATLMATGGGAPGVEAAGSLQIAELAETSVDGLQVGLQVLQQLVILLDDALSSEEVRAKAVQPPAPLLAAKLQNLIRRLVCVPSVTPDVRNVCRRLLKTLSAFDDLDPEEVLIPDTPAPPPSETEPNTPTSATSAKQRAAAAANGNPSAPPAAEPPHPTAAGTILSTTASLHRPWGYPFCPPRTAVLAASSRHKRESTMQTVLEAATYHLTTSPAEPEADLGPVLGATGGPRLDDRTFWRDLEGGAVGVDISGPSDPLVLTASYRLQVEDPTNLEVTLKAFNRLDTEVDGVEVHMRLVGAMLTERRGASWHVPKLVPYEVARHQFVLKMIGFSRMEVHCKVQLPVGRAGDPIPPVLNCEPFSIPLSALLHPPSPPPSPPTFFSNWQTLPLSAHLSGLCSWSGVEGMLLFLSVLERQPLHRMWLRTLPALSSCQAAYASLTAANEPVALVVTMQLMPADDGTLAGSITSARAAVEMTVRSTSHEVVSTIEHHSGQWIADVSQGSLTHGLRTPHAPPSASKPSLHPDIAPLLHLYHKSKPLQRLATSKTEAAAQLKRLTIQDPTLLLPEANDAPDEVGQGNWVRSTALSEWRRMCSAAV